jgi:hypothetical protein
MRSAVVLAVVLAIGGTASLYGRKQNEASPLAGNWTVNYSKSKLSPAFKFQSTTLQITIAGDTVTMASRLVDPAGQEQRAAETFRTDGTETAGTLNPGVTLVARWLDPHVLASLAKKGGQVIALVTYEVSPDGKTLTSRSSGTLDQVIVFERQ